MSRTEVESTPKRLLPFASPQSVHQMGLASHLWQNAAASLRSRPFVEGDELRALIEPALGPLGELGKVEFIRSWVLRAQYPGRWAQRTRMATFYQWVPASQGLSQC